MIVYPYLSFDGKCEEALNFYGKVLNAEVKFWRFGDAAGFPVADQYKNRIMNGSVKGNSFVFMASDTLPGMTPPLHGASDISVTIIPDSVSEAERIFSALSEGGKIVMPLEKTSWAEKYGMLVDRYNITWQINAGTVI
jgi:PhnB protein